MRISLSEASAQFNRSAGAAQFNRSAVQVAASAWPQEPNGQWRLVPAEFQIRERVSSGFPALHVEQGFPRFEIGEQLT
jgi:hypothetical protein